jgi:hypothetical protein
MGKGGSGSTVQKSEVTQSNLPEYARPYYEGLMQRASTTLTTPYQTYDQERIAGFTPQQQGVQQNIMNQQTPGQFGSASTLATASGLGSLQASQYNPGQFNSQQIGMPNLQQYSMQNPGNVQAQQYRTPQMGAAQTGYNPSLNNYQMQQPGDVQGYNVQSQDMQAAQTGYNPNLDYFQMQGPQNFGSTQAQQYMSPYTQNVIDVQKNEAIRDAQKGQLAQNLGAVRQGTYGGARQLLAQTENQRNLNTQLGGIQAQGQQAAYENAQQQFERDRAAGMTTGQQNLAARLGVQELGANIGTQTSLANLSNQQQAAVNNQAQQFQAQGMNAQQAMQAALANQQMGFNTGQQNQQAALQTQQLGTQTGLQAALANLDSASQANVQNLAAQLQTQGLNSEQAMRAALANQQAGPQVGQQNLESALQTQQLGTQSGLAALQSNQQSDLERQRMAEQSRQFGSQQGLAGLAQANQSAQTLANIGSAQQNADQARLGMQQGTAAQQQALNQQYLDTAYQDFVRQRDYPMEQMQQYSSLLRGVPVTPNSTTTSYAPTPSIGTQLLGGGLGAAALYNTANRAGVI